MGEELRWKTPPCSWVFYYFGRPLYLLNGYIYIYAVTLEQLFSQTTKTVCKYQTNEEKKIFTERKKMLRYENCNEFRDLLLYIYMYKRCCESIVSVVQKSAWGWFAEPPPPNPGEGFYLESFLEE